MSEDLRRCCNKPALESFPCVDGLNRQSHQSPDVANPVSSQLCDGAQPHGIDRCLFNIHQIFRGSELMRVLKERLTRKDICNVSQLISL